MSRRWFVLGAGLSPYTLDLWEAVASRPGQNVTLAFVPQPRQSDFAHEGDFAHSILVELVPVSLRTVPSLAIRCLRSPDSVVVCMGYSPIYNLAVSALLRRTRNDDRLLFYMSDTNGLRASEGAARSLRSFVMSFGKRLALGTTFTTSLDLGFSNGLAHRLLGIDRGIELPLLPVDFPRDLEPILPRAIASRVESLPSPRLLTVARLVPQKNLSALIAAFTDAARNGMPGSLTIIGEGPEHAALEASANVASDRIFLAGAIPFREARRIFGAFDGMVLPSLFEPWAIAIIEALGWGVPVLASKECGAGISMALELGTAVRLCGTSRETLRDALTEFVCHLDHYSRAAREAAPAVRKKFGLNEVADRLIMLADPRVS